MGSHAGSFAEAVAALGRGESIVVWDDACPQPNASLICAAASVTPEQISFLVNLGRSIILAPISETRLKELGLPPMVPTRNRVSQGIDFAISVESRHRVSTGISAADRAQTLRTLALTSDPRHELVTPGHIFPLRAKSGGVLVRADIAEACIDLLEHAALPPVGVACHWLGPTGEFLGRRDVDRLAAEHQLLVVSLSEIIQYRLAHEQIVESIARAHLPTETAGLFTAVCFRSRTDGAEHLALIKGQLGGDQGTDGASEPVLVRVQSEHRLGDLFGFSDSPGWQKIHGALRAIDQRGSGVFVYVRHPKRGLLTEQARLAQIARQPGTAVRGGPAGERTAGTLREYGIGAQILSVLGVRRIRLLSNAPVESPLLAAFGLDIVESVPFAAFVPPPVSVPPEASAEPTSRPIKKVLP